MTTLRVLCFLEQQMKVLHLVLMKAGFQRSIRIFLLTQMVIMYSLYK